MKVSTQEHILKVFDSMEYFFGPHSHIIKLVVGVDNNHSHILMEKALQRNLNAHNYRKVTALCKMKIKQNAVICKSFWLNWSEFDASLTFQQATTGSLVTVESIMIENKRLSLLQVLERVEHSAGNKVADDAAKHWGSNSYWENEWECWDQVT